MEGWQNLHTTMQPITNALRYEYLTWYHGSQGPTPLDSLMMTDNATLQAQWHEGYQQNGPNGSLASVWGQVPKYR